ncbi:MAG: hypothetical protein WBB25_01825 [Sulfitobacter sp.]
MSNENTFAQRVNRINKTAHQKRPAKSRSARRPAERLITPLMLICCLAGGITAAWETMDRPTGSPLDLAGDLTSRVMSYFSTI